MVHGDNMLLNNTYPAKWRQDIEMRLRRRGINLVLGDIVPQETLASDNTSVKTQHGKTFTPDLIVSHPRLSPCPYTLIGNCSFR